MASDSGSQSSVLGEAAQAFKAQDFGRACELFRGVVEAEPGNAKAWFFLGQALVKLGQPREALAAFKQAAEGTDPRVAGLARQAAEGLVRPAPPVPVVEEPAPEPEPVTEPAASEPEEAVEEPSEEPVEHHPEGGNPRREPVQPCPRCGLPIPRELWDTPRCPCGYGQLESRTGPVDRIYLSTLLAYQRAARGAIELNIRNDHYTLAGKLKVKQLSARATEIDPRMVFPTDRGLPYLRREDLGVVKNDQNKDANFALGFGGFFTWDEGLAEFERVLGPEGLRPAGGLGVLLLDYGGMEEADVATAEGQVCDGTLGEVLVWGWGSPLEDVITAALGARVATPVHQGANAIGHQLLAQGAITPEQLTKAVMTQLTARKPLLELLGGDRLPADQVQAAQEAIAAAGWPLPARDEVGEQLYRRGLLGRTDLAQAQRHAQ
jgi:tetratricopeptide (TPR) repeat protein